MKLIPVIYPVGFDYDLDPEQKKFVWIDLCISRDSLFVTCKKRDYKLPVLLETGVNVTRSLLVGLVQRMVEIPTTTKAKVEVNSLKHLGKPSRAGDLTWYTSEAAILGEGSNGTVVYR